MSLMMEAGLLGGMGEYNLAAVKMKGPKIVATREILTITVKSQADIIDQDQGLMREDARDTIEADHLEIDQIRNLGYKI